MSCPFGLRVATLFACTLLLAAAAASGCAAASGDDEATAPLGVSISDWYVTVENRTGSPLVDGKVEIIPAGPTVFQTSFPRMENRERRDFTLDTFRAIDGTPFRRGVIRARRVKVSAKDINGKVYEREVPFE